MNWFTKLRRKLWLTRKERWADGWSYARQLFHEHGRDIAMDILWNNPRDYDHPFDQGIFDYIAAVRHHEYLNYPQGRPLHRL